MARIECCMKPVSFSRPIILLNTPLLSLHTNIFCSSEDLSQSIIIESWLAKQAVTNSDELQYLVENYFNKAVEWIEENQKRYVLYS